MQTSRTVSNISYNSVKFLRGKLDYLYSIGVIDYWAFIKHKPEFEKDNQANKKEHIHMMFKPGKRIQTNILIKEFYELDPNSDKPLKPTDDWRIVSSFADWWLYALHDKQYLQHKHLEREYHYSIDDFYFSDKDTLERLISFIDLGELYRQERMFDAAEAGLSYKKAMARGIFGEHPQRYAALYSALLQDTYLEKYEQKKYYDDQYYRNLKGIFKNKEV